MFFQRGLFFLLCVGLPGVLVAETAQCAGGQITVHSDDPGLIAPTCAHATAAMDALAQCNVVITRPVEITLRDSLPPGCLGQYHCGEDHIEILTPGAMSERRVPTSLLQRLDEQTYFASVLAHELTHAAYEPTPCPYDTCLATSEYLAHTMQLMSLPDADIASIEAELDMDTAVPRDTLNAMLYFMAPDKFLRKAWVHLNQRPDACRFVGEIMAGRVYLDRPHF